MTTPDLLHGSPVAPFSSSRCREFAPGSPERASVGSAIAGVRSSDWDIPNLIGRREVRTGRTHSIVIPHDHQVQLGRFHAAGAGEVTAAIEAANHARCDWSTRSLAERAEPFRRAADLLEFGPIRDRMVAACMLELSNTSLQAEGDAAAETVDFIRATSRTRRACLPCSRCRRTALTITSSIGPSRVSCSR